MSIVTSKITVKALMDEALAHYHSSDPDKFIKQLHTQLLKKKVRFPLLEYSAKELYQALPEKEQQLIADKIIALQEIGNNVLAAIILQLRLPKHFKQSLTKAGNYIIASDQWYVCDIIGERVFGYALLTQPEKTIPELQKLTWHPNKWLVRSVGVATHYAVKKGLKKVYSDQMFQMLLSCSSTTDFHTKKGFGWAAKTIAKFHPEIIQRYKERIETNPEIKQWFKTKIKIGLGRSFKYATKYTD